MFEAVSAAGAGFFVSVSASVVTFESVPLDFDVEGSWQGSEFIVKDTEKVSVVA